jgi:predicted ATPase
MNTPPSWQPYRDAASPPPPHRQQTRSLAARRLLTPTGTGGVGKTRLAIGAAREAKDFFPDGVHLVGLASLNDSALVLPTIAQAPGQRKAERRAPRGALHAFLREKQLLMVLDNFEHVIEAAPEVAALVEGCQDLTVLLTSRAPLRDALELAA